MFGFLFAFLIAATSIYIKNNGGADIRMPLNLMTLFAVGAFIIFFALQKLPRKKHNHTILIGATLYLVPWILSSPFAYGWIIFAIIMVLWVCIDGVVISNNLKNKIITATFALAVIQAFISLVQFLFPSIALTFFEYSTIKYAGRPSGIFQQINLLSSFLATGLGCGLLSFVRDSHKCKYLIKLPLLGLLSFVIVISKSRTGELGLILVTLMVMLALYKSYKKDVLLAFYVIVGMVLFGVYITEYSSFAIDRGYADSDFERFNYLLIIFKMILEKPILGWGYGTFEYNFSRYVLSHPELPYVYKTIVTHPHNEFFYTWYQGGVLPAAGLVIIFYAWCNGICRSIVEKSDIVSYKMLIIPLFIHLNLEYPFYQSFIHLTVFVLLLRLGENEHKTENISNTGVAVLSRASIGALGIMIIAYSLVGFYTARELTQLEREGLVNYPRNTPWYFKTQPERTEFDSMVSLLIHYNYDRKGIYLDEFLQRSEQWLKVHNDRNIWRDTIMIELNRGQDVKVASMLIEYNKLFPEHPMSFRKNY